MFYYFKLKQIIRFYQTYKLDIAAFITLTAVLIKLVSNLLNYLDVLFLDDSFYLMAGVRFFELPYKAFGQLYRFRFWLMHLWENDLVNLYYLNYKVSLFVTPLLLYIFLRRIKLAVLPAFFLAFFFAVSPIHVTTWPRVSHMCIEILLLSMVISTFIKSNFHKLFLFSLTALALSYIRNEFFMSFAFLTGILIIWGIVRAFRVKDFLFIPFTIITCALFILISYKFGNPMAGDGAGRAVIAFGQHFAYNYVSWNNLDEPFWITWIDIMQKVFGDTVDFKTAFGQNKEILFKHLISNFTNFFHIQFQNLADLLLPNSIINFSSGIKLIIAGAAGGFVFYRYKNADAKKEIKESSLTFTFFVLSIILLPTFIASFLIYPRDHYLVMQVLLIILLIAIYLKSIKIDSPSRLWALFILLTAFLISPEAKDFEFFNLLRKNEGTPNAEAIHKLNEIYTGADSLIIFDHEGGIVNFVEEGDDKKLWLTRLGMDTTFVPYIQKEKVNVIYHSDFLYRDPKINKDSTWQAFISNPEAYDFERVNLTTGPKERYLLIKRGFN